MDKDLLKDIHSREYFRENKELLRHYIVWQKKIT